VNPHSNGDTLDSSGLLEDNKIFNASKIKDKTGININNIKIGFINMKK